MITVVIYINGTPIYTRTAINVGREDKEGTTLYKTDVGKDIRHMRDEGAVVLAMKMLSTVKDVAK